jgi:hypothetical protein
MLRVTPKFPDYVRLQARMRSAPMGKFIEDCVRAALDAKLV